MSEDNKGTERVTFSRGYDVCLMAIDGTWRRDCQLNSISDTEATLTVEGSIQGLNLKEFFLLLSSTGLAYRRCELVRVNGTEMDIHFLRGKQAKKRSGAAPKNRRNDELRRSRQTVLSRLERGVASPSCGGVPFGCAAACRTPDRRSGFIARDNPSRKDIAGSRKVQLSGYIHEIEAAGPTSA